MRTKARRTNSMGRAQQCPPPFPPIAEYAFLSNCHTGALVAPNGNIDWLCVPRFDSPSIFATLLDRQAIFRLGPFGVTTGQRQYERGTNTMITAWKTRGAWLIVRESLRWGRGGARTP